MSNVAELLRALGVPLKAATLESGVLSLYCKRARFLTQDEIIAVMAMAGELSARTIAIFIDGVCFVIEYIQYINMLLTCSSFESFVRTWEIASGDYHFSRV